MRFGHTISIGIAAAACALIMTGVPGVAQADCPPFPQSQNMGAYTHAQVRGYVNKAHGGDWTPYLVALQTNIERLQSLMGSDRPVVLKVRGTPTEMSAATLARFVFESQQFLSVARCLAEDQNLKSLADFSTAAGGASEPAQAAPRSEPVQVAALTDGADATQRTVTRRDRVAGVSNPLDVEISAKCVDGETEFQVVNKGDSWPSTGVVSIFRVDGPNRQMVNARRYEMQGGELKSFKVAGARNPTGQLGLAIEPSWYSRPFVMDAYARCK